MRRGPRGRRHRVVVAARRRAAARRLVVVAVVVVVGGSGGGQRVVEVGVGGVGARGRGVAEALDQRGPAPAVTVAGADLDQRAPSLPPWSLLLGSEQRSRRAVGR